MSLESNASRPIQPQDRGNVPVELTPVMGGQRELVTSAPAVGVFISTPEPRPELHLEFSEDSLKKLHRFFDPSARDYVTGYLLLSYQQASTQESAYKGMPLRRLSISGHAFHFFDLASDGVLLVVDIVPGDDPDEGGGGPKPRPGNPWIQALIRFAMKWVVESTPANGFDLFDTGQRVSSGGWRARGPTGMTVILQACGDGTLSRTDAVPTHGTRAFRLAPALSSCVIAWSRGAGDGAPRPMRRASHWRARGPDAGTPHVAHLSAIATASASVRVDRLGPTTEYADPANTGALMTFSAFSGGGAPVDSTATAIVDFGATPKPPTAAPAGNPVGLGGRTDAAKNARTLGTDASPSSPAAKTHDNADPAKTVEATPGHGAVAVANLAEAVDAMPTHGAVTLAGIADVATPVPAVNGADNKADIPRDIDVRAIRARLAMTQEDFALTFGLSVASLRNWEQGIRTPERPIALYLRLIDRFPDQVKEEVAAARGMH